MRVGCVGLCSVQQLFKLTLFELSIVSDFIKCVHLHNLPILKDCVQQVLEKHRETSSEGVEGGGGVNKWEGDKGGERKCRSVLVKIILFAGLRNIYVYKRVHWDVGLTMPYSSRSPLPSSRVT